MVWPFNKKPDPPPEKKEPTFKRARSSPSSQGPDFNENVLSRGFKAADEGRLFNSWSTGPQTADEVINTGYRATVARSRDMSINNDYIRKFLRDLKNNVVGANGFKFKSLVFELKDGEEVADKDARTALERAYREWGKVSDFKDRLSLIDQHGLILRTVATNGECFVRRHRRGAFGFELEIIDNLLIDPAYFGMHNGNSILFGIEVDSERRPVAYHKTSADTSRGYYSHVMKSQIERVPAADIYHVFEQEIPEQLRGIPWTASSLTRLKMLDGYEEAALVAIRTAASTCGFFSNKEDPDAEYEGDEIDENGQKMMNAESGVFRNIGDMHLETFNPSYPAGEMVTFVTQCLRGAAGGLGIDSCSLSSNYSDVNYSSARIAQLDTREQWEALQNWLVRILIEPVFLDWLAVNYRLGTIKIPHKSGVLKRIDKKPIYYSAHKFQGRRWDWVDPDKAQKANKAAYEMKTTTISKIIREQGDDPEEIFTEWAEEREAMKALGINPQEFISDFKGGKDAKQEPETD